MSVNYRKIIKWTKMLFGKSLSHVNQSEGLLFSKDAINGYYNNLTEKITLSDGNRIGIPKTKLDNGKEIFFSIEIFQYGLAAFDLFLLTGNREYIEMTRLVADWAVENQLPNGGWITFAHKSPDYPFSAMAQGEGISILARAYKHFGNNEYLKAAQSAYDFMLLPIDSGGTAKIEDNYLALYECTNEPVILNGWIFASWGIYDYYLLTNDEKAGQLWGLTVNSLANELKNFDNGFWSKYNNAEMICSPFYHRLHIAQLNVMYILTGNETFKLFADRWKKYLNNPICKTKAFIIKAYQKIKEQD